VEQVLDVTDARDLAYLVLDALDLLGIFELPPQDHDPAVSVDADRSFGNGPVAEQLALYLAYETDVVKLRYGVVMVSNRVREPHHLAGLVMGLALDLARAATERGRRTIANEVPSPFPAVRVEEELQRRARSQSGRGTRRQFTS
jgi:hypothetical protein